jgi:hypothetical protein
MLKRSNATSVASAAPRLVRSAVSRCVRQAEDDGLAIDHDVIDGRARTASAILKKVSL